MTLNKFHWAAAGVVALGASDLAAQPDWTPLFGARSSHSMAYTVTSSGGETMLFGGEDAAGNVLDEVWVSRSGGWEPGTQSSRPPARSGHASVSYPDPGGSNQTVTLIYGGFGPNRTPLDDTYLYVGESFGEITSVPRPQVTTPAMAYDATRGVVVLYGAGASGPETWEWDPSSEPLAWQRRFPANSPSAMFQTALAYDPARSALTGQGCVLLFGGWPTPYPGLLYWEEPNETYCWDGSDWTLLPTPVSPPPRGSSLDGDRYATAASRPLCRAVRFVRFLPLWNRPVGVGWFCLARPDRPCGLERWSLAF